MQDFDKLWQRSFGVFQKLQEESVWIIHSSVETCEKVTLDELASCALLALLWAFVSWFVIRSLHNDFPTDGGFPSPFKSLPRFFGKTIQFDLCDSKTTSFFRSFWNHHSSLTKNALQLLVALLMSRDLPCFLGLKRQRPGLFAAWAHGDYGNSAAKTAGFLRGSNMSQRSCHVWSSKAAMKMTLCDNPHSHFPPPHLDPFWHWQHQVETVWWIWSHIASTGGTLSHCPNECQKSRISLWHFSTKKLKHTMYFPCGIESAMTQRFFLCQNSFQIPVTMDVTDAVCQELVGDRCVTT